MPAAKKASTISAELVALKAKRQKLQARIEPLRDELDQLRAKLAEIDAAIFEREDGRLLRVVKKIMETNDPNFSQFTQMVRAYIDRDDLDGSLPKAIKVKKNGPIAQAVAASSAAGAAAAATK